MDEAPRRADLWLARDSEDPQVLVVGLPWAPGEPGIALAPLAVRDRFGRFGTYLHEADVDISGVRARDAGNWPTEGLDLDGLRRYLTDRIADTLPPAGLTIFIGGADQIANAIIAALPNASTALIRVSSAPSWDRSGIEDVETVTIGVHGFSDHRGDPNTSAISISQIEMDGVQVAVDHAIEVAASTGKAHVSVDLDVLDPSFAPGSPDAHPGGMDVRRLAEVVRLCAASTFTHTMDFVGQDTDLDPSGRTTDITAHLLLSAVAGYRNRAQTA